MASSYPDPLDEYKPNVDDLERTETTVSSITAHATEDISKIVERIVEEKLVIHVGALDKKIAQLTEDFAKALENYDEELERKNAFAAASFETIRTNVIESIKEGFETQRTDMASLRDLAIEAIGSVHGKIKSSTNTTKGAIDDMGAELQTSIENAAENVTLAVEDAAENIEVDINNNVARIERLTDVYSPKRKVAPEESVSSTKRQQLDQSPSLDSVPNEADDSHSSHDDSHSSHDDNHSSPPTIYR